jgi:hypothetical protein
MFLGPQPHALQHIEALFNGYSTPSYNPHSYLYFQISSSTLHLSIPVNFMLIDSYK